MNLDGLLDETYPPGMRLNIVICILNISNNFESYFSKCLQYLITYASCIFYLLIFIVYVCQLKTFVRSCIL